MIAFENFSCYYKVKGGYLAALDEISFQVHDGELLSVVGTSGCGKTTLLKCILNLTQNTSGKLLIDGIPANEISYRDNIFAYVSQAYVLYPHLTIYENIAYPLRTMKTKQEEVDIRVREIAKVLELSAFLNRKPKQLSGGQQQRVAIARAIIKNPQYILMDEPFSNLAQDMRYELREVVRNIHKTYHATIIFVTHDIGEAFSLADRLLVLENGNVVESGTPNELRKKNNSDLLKRFFNDTDTIQ